MGTMKTANGSQPEQANNATIEQRGNRFGDTFAMGHGNIKQATLIKLALAATEAFVLVDLSDVANFPHSETGKIRLYGLTADLQTEATGVYIVYVGTIIEVDADNGSTDWLLALLVQTDDNPTDDDGHRQYRISWPEGVDLEVEGGAMVNTISNDGHSGNAAWQTDVALDSPRGDGLSAPGPGDLVMYVEETGGTGTISLSVTADYISEAVS